jgi:hypothetical protein
MSGSGLEPRGRERRPSAPIPIIDDAGELRNPQRLVGLALEAPAAGATTLSVVLSLGERRASGHLLLTRPADGGPEERILTVDRGVFQLTPQEREALRAAFLWPEGRWSFRSALPTRQPGRTPVHAWLVCVEALRARLREVRLDELREVVDLGRAGRVGASFLEHSRWLELSSAEEFAAKHDFDGRRPLRQAIFHGGISEAALLRLAFMLRALGLVELVVPGEAT